MVAPSTIPEKARDDADQVGDTAKLGVHFRVVLGVLARAPGRHRAQQAGERTMVRWRTRMGVNKKAIETVF